MCIVNIDVNCGREENREMKNIRNLRLKLGLTQVELAKAIKVSQETISGWESGKIMPMSDKLPELAKVLGCSIDELYGKE